MNIIRHTEADGAVRLALSGELDLATVDMLHDHVEQALNGRRSGRLVVDLAGVTFCDSTGIGALVDARAAALRGGVSFQATNPRGITRRTMQIVGVHDVLTAISVA